MVNAAAAPPGRKKVAKKFPIYHLSFPNQYLLAATFLRFQEHYESPRFRDLVFSWEEFMDWYAAQKGAFTYLDDWSGFNIPSSVLRLFRDGLFDPLTAKERALLDLVRGLPEPFYVIGTVAGEADDLRHEIVHGLFSVSLAYRAAAIACLREFKTRRLRDRVRRMGYHRKVVEDEINAYVLTGLADELRGLVPRGLKRRLRQVFAEHFGFDPCSRDGRRRLLRGIRRLRFRRP